MQLFKYDDFPHFLHHYQNLGIFKTGVCWTRSFFEIKKYDMTRALLYGNM